MKKILIIIVLLFAVWYYFAFIHFKLESKDEFLENYIEKSASSSEDSDDEPYNEESTYDYDDKKKKNEYSYDDGNKQKNEFNREKSQKNRSSNTADITRIKYSIYDESPSSYSCDGRTKCVQMHSCEEAKFFHKNCQGVMMDGDKNGIPCESQWCGGGIY